MCIQSAKYYGDWPSVPDLSDKCCIILYCNVMTLLFLLLFSYTCFIVGIVGLYGSLFTGLALGQLKGWEGGRELLEELY